MTAASRSRTAMRRQLLRRPQGARRPLHRTAARGVTVAPTVHIGRAAGARRADPGPAGSSKSSLAPRLSALRRPGCGSPVWSQTIACTSSPVDRLLVRPAAAAGSSNARAGIRRPTTSRSRSWSSGRSRGRYPRGCRNRLRRVCGVRLRRLAAAGNGQSRACRPAPAGLWT
jgi:hypothetical protein